MRAHSSKLPFLFLMTLLLVSRLSSCRHIHGLVGDRLREEPLKYQSRRPEYPLRLRLSGEATVGSTGDRSNDPIFGASQRVTPGGPNPLHN
ncbi:uncharacterized protein J3R85_011834 [Psidium guajava]|nr:uncharacterized protein J3R85_011834 [Psidium guajava]